MSVKVVDALMGSGKSSSCITYMNEHKTDKFIYITPYLKEAERIRLGCPDLHFVEPSDKIAKYDFKKTKHTAALIRNGANITTTHQAFKGYTPDMLEDVKAHNYTLIIDENVDVLEKFDFSCGDVQLLVDAGYLENNNGIYRTTDKDYGGKAFTDVFRLLKSRELIGIDDGNNEQLYFWSLPPDLISSFKEVFVLTYMFDGQSLCSFFKIYDIPYEKIGIRYDNGTYRFSESDFYVPEYAHRIKSMLHILDNPKMNAIGEDYSALSMNWYKTKHSDVRKLKDNVYNAFRNIWSDIPADRKMWGSYSGECEKIKGKGYTKSFVTFNARATNEYGDRDCLVYIANAFMNVNEKKFYNMHGIEVDEDAYALSIMVQWIWRSAIRNGREINLYIPSRRMRNLLIEWMDNISKNGGEHDIEQ